MSSEIILSNPVELGVPFAGVVLEDINLVHGQREAEVAIDLEGMATDLDLFGKYYLESTQAFAVPASFDANEDVDYIAYSEGLMMSGVFTTFSFLKIGRILGAKDSVRALCLLFDETYLITHETPVPESSLLLVPVLSVCSISRDSS